MNKISTSDVKKLRDLTGAGFLDCKEALENSSSDIDKAIEFLRKKGISSAQKINCVVSLVARQSEIRMGKAANKKKPVNTLPTN